MFLSHQGESKRTQDPIVTGTSIVALKYKDGVMIAADTLASYGSLARFRDVRRISSLGSNTLLAGSGEYSDYQYLIKTLDQMILEYELPDDGSTLSPKSLQSYITRLMYSRRNKFDPLWNQLVLAGYSDGNSTLGYSDLHGTSYEDDTVATGYGNYIARPLLRRAYKPNMTKDEAKQLLETCLKVLFYRDARSSNRIQIATATAEGTFISEPYELETDWRVGEILYTEPAVRTVAVYKKGNNNSKD